MRIGVDGQYLTRANPSGHYTLTLELLRGFRSLQRRDQISVFIRPFSEWKEEEARVRSRVGDTGFPVRGHGVPGRPYRLRQRFAAIHWLDLFLYLSETGFPPGKRRCNAFMIADLIPLKAPQWATEEVIQAWTRYYDMAREHGDVFLAFSEHVKNDMVETLGIPRDRIEVVPLAAGRHFRPIADRGAIAEQLRHWGLEIDNYVLSVGTLEPRKNHCLIVEAYERLRASGRLPRGCKLVFAGAQGWMYEPILERIDSLGLREEVVLLGPADPLEYLYNGAIMMIFPSFLEGFGLPPLEAMGCGTPVITSNTSSLPEVVGDAGIMVDPHDVDGLVETMCRVLSDPVMREEMRTKGLIRAAEFTWERTASGYMDVLTKAYAKFIKSRAYKQVN
jgi:glycosyltransferase involved in cell wall biosynthesis